LLTWYIRSVKITRTLRMAGRSGITIMLCITLLRTLSLAKLDFTSSAIRLSRTCPVRDPKLYMELIADLYSPCRSSARYDSSNIRRSPASGWELRIAMNTDSHLQANMTSQFLLLLSATTLTAVFGAPKRMAKSRTYLETSSKSMVSPGLTCGSSLGSIACAS
jgi:hypothetical protein